jgi:hypothetical protein
MAEPDNLVLELLRAIRTEVSESRAELKEEISGVRAELKGEISSVRSELKSDINSLRADIASDMLVFRKEINEQIGGLRRAVVDYHSSVVGHGVLISDLEERVRRLEDHLHSS